MFNANYTYYFTHTEHSVQSLNKLVYVSTIFNFVKLWVDALLQKLYKHYLHMFNKSVYRLHKIVNKDINE